MATYCVPLTSCELGENGSKVPLPLITSGILSKIAAKKSLDVGAGAIPCLTTVGTPSIAPHPLQVTEEMISAVGGKLVVIADGVFRGGSNVLKTLAFEASLVGLGRPILYGLAEVGK